MRNILREVVQGFCLTAVFFGLLFVDENIKVAAVIVLTSMLLFLLFEKGIL